MEQYYMEPEKKIPVHTACDVLIAGGGTAGVVAAVASARTGARTILVEQNGYLGGTIHGGVCAVNSFFNNWQAYGVPKKQVVKGIADEIIQRLKARGASPGHIDAEIGWQQFAVITLMDREEYKLLAFEMLEEAGVEVYLHTMCADVIVQDGILKGILIESKNGREVIWAKEFIDCTGDGDIAAKAGCKLIEPTQSYPVGLVFAAGGVDIPKFADYLKRNNALESVARGDKGSLTDPYIRVCSSFYANRELKKMANQLGIWGVYINSLHEGEMTYINGCNTSALRDFSPEEYTRVERENRKRVEEMMEAFRKVFPGFERAFISWISPASGIRRTRVIACEYDLSSEEIEGAAHFQDEIGLFAYHDMAPKHHIKDGGWYGIPYRALIPQQIENLLLAGRMITSDKIAHMSTRNSACCMVQGQAAGTAAAMCAQRGLTPRLLDPQILREKLREDGVCLE